MRPSPVIRALATSFLAGESSVEEVYGRASHTLGRRWPWLRFVAKRFVRLANGRTRLCHREVVRFLRQDSLFERALQRYRDEIFVKHWPIYASRMQPAKNAAGWPIPRIESEGALADWLDLETGELEWLADLNTFGSKSGREQLRNYHYRILAKQFGTIRLIEAPKKTLKSIQRKILTDILEKIPAHPAAHAFNKGRSIRTYVAPHVGRIVVLRLDLQDYFPSFGRARIQAMFRTVGYPERVADLLGGICTNSAPRSIWKSLVPEVHLSLVRDASLLYARHHLPQGAPTSPALANLCSYRFDCRLAGLAKAAGATYTRYADDLAFSGDAGFERAAERFSLHVAAILMEEGFRVHYRKTRVMRSGVRQHLAGLVINQRLNVHRRDYDRLKATLTNCVRHGPKSQNREGYPDFRAHLQGRLAFVAMVHPDRAAKLRATFDRIVWD